MVNFPRKKKGHYRLAFQQAHTSSLGQRSKVQNFIFANAPEVAKTRSERVLKITGQA